MKIKNKKLFTLLLSLIISIFIVLIIGETGVLGLTKDAKVYIGPRSIYNTNYFCVQHGTQIIGQNYKVTTNFIKVKDPTLNYILCYGSRSAVRGYWVNETQVALWRYLFNNRYSQGTDITNILSGISDNINNVYSYDNLYKSDYNNGIELYNEAVENGDKTNNVDVKMIVDERTATSITFTVTGDYERFEVYKNNNLYESYQTKDNETITLEGITESTKIKVKAYKKVPQAYYQVLKATDKTNKDVSQRIIIVDKSYDEISDTTTELFKPELDVSLQKYIVAVGGKTVGADGGVSGNDYEQGSDYNYNLRRRKATKQNEKSKRVKNQISKLIENSVNENSEYKYKYDNPVSIADTSSSVTYKIIVYNNTNKEIKNIKVTERFPNIDDKMCVTIEESKIYWIYNDNTMSSATNIKSKWNKIDKTVSDYMYTFDFDANVKRAEIYITVKFNNYKSGKIANTAWVDVDNNQKTYRTLDRDYVQFKTDVSLQKYIVSVNGESVTKENDKNAGTAITTGNQYNSNNQNNRKKLNSSEYNLTNYPKKYNNNIANNITVSNEDKQTYKHDNPVGINVGDIVKYRITVYNNSDIKASDITIKDTLPTYKANSCVEVLNLWEYDNDTAPTENNGKPISDNQWDLDEDNNTLSWRTDLEAGATKYFIMEVKFIAGRGGPISNMAEIESVDGGNTANYRQADRDYVQITEIVNNEPDVSLQKYIINTTSKNLGYTRKKQMTVAADDGRVKEAISKSITANAERYKSEEPVEVKNGEEVTYRISVYNNSTIEVKGIKIKDELPSCAEVVKITQGSNNTDVTWRQSGNELSYTIDSLEAEGETYFLITVKINGAQKDKVYANTVWIDSVEDGNKGTYRTLDRDYIKIVQPDVSLQKYIVNTTTKDLGSTRKEQMTSKDETNECVKQDISYKIIADANKYKNDNPVEIENGEEVTYRISVYNNSSNVAENILIEDTLPSCATEVLRITQESDNTDVTSSWTRNLNNNTLSYKIDSLEAKGETHFLITVKINGAEKDVYANTVEIVSVDGGNSGTYRTVDRDYIKLENYSVSLEKFVSKVEGFDVQPARDGKRHNEFLNDGDPNKSMWKNSTTNDGAGPVNVEVGNTITYTIRLKNTGDAPVKVTRIYDSYRYNDYGGTLNYGLQYVESYGIKATYNNITKNDYGTIIDDHYLETNNSEKTLNRYLIEFKDAELLDKDEYVDITMQFKVFVKEGTNIPDIAFYNKAGIKELKNSDNNNVTDSDGENNNYDMDWVKPGVYSVSLEKYVSKVNGNNILEPNLPREGKRHNDALNDGNLNKSMWKKSTTNNGAGPVKVDSKDETVTYTIKLENTGSLPIKVTQIYDTYGYYDTNMNITINNQKNVGLKFDINSSENANVRNHYGIEVEENYGGNIGSYFERILLKITKNNLIQPGSNIKIDLVFEVDIPSNIANNNKILFNKAGIVWEGIENEYKRVNDTDGSENNHDMDWVQIFNSKLYQISLEKYVSKVNNNTNLDPNVTRLGHPIYNDPQKVNPYKKNNAVKVYLNNSVTYTIKLVNTGTNAIEYGSIKNIKVKDETPAGLTYAGCNNAIDNKDGTFTYNGEIPVGGSAVFTITYTVNNALAENTLIENVAEIVEICNKNGDKVSDNDGPNNNVDKDWIRTRRTAVAIQKYVTSVYSPGTGETVNYTDRINHRHNEERNNFKDTTDAALAKNYDQHKPNHKVEVEAGDIVTFTIKLINTGEMPVSITQIYDSYRYYSSTGTGLKYIENSLNGNGNLYTVQDRYLDEGDTEKEIDRILIDFENAQQIQPQQFIDLTINFEVVSTIAGKLDTLYNKAGIRKIKDYYGNEKELAHMALETEKDFDGPDNNYDNDFLEIQEYKVSLQKIVYSVNNNTNFDSTFGTDSRWNSWESHANTCDCSWKNKACVDSNKDKQCDSCNYDMSTDSTHNAEKYNQGNVYAKHNNPAIASNGNQITYAIKVKNDGDTKVAISSIEDIFSGNQGSKFTDIFKINSNGGGFSISAKKRDVTYNHATNPYCSLGYKDASNHNLGLKIWTNILLEPNEELTMYLTGTIKLSNMSTEVIRNEAIIRDLSNKNGETVYDTTQSNNNDADYFQMKDITISGKVWNDKATNKEQNNYDGLYNNGENNLQGITVKLYRDGTTSPIATKTTNSDGSYTFTDTDISTSVITDKCQIKIKGPYKCRSAEAGNNKVEHGANYWSGTYYSYYIVFEYDGVTYTSTFIADQSNTLGIFNNVDNDSNAKEDNSNGKSGLTTREEFNDRFETINNGSGISYATKNETGKIPQSIHQYNSNMAMQSSTNKIELSINTNLEQLQHVNLGLRGKDIFDLELISDVDTIKVTVNGKQGVYNYTNKVRLRQADLYNEIEDMANIASERSNTYVETKEQSLRNTDFNVNTNKYSQNQGISAIEVTYRITVHNASRTAGTATKVVNYYDSKYSINSDKGKVAYYYKTEADKQSDKKTWVTADEVSNGDSERGYKSVIINTQATKLEQADKMEIYVVYKLNTPINTTLSGLTKDNKIPTYNMAEIAEYTTECGAGQTEYTRGLIDKDSAPGSANTEQVRTTDTEGQNTATTGGNPTTVRYYFNANGLEKLKYEDDTYATPTLYFVIPDDTNIRKITGIVFEDNTIINGETRIKTGNGKLDEGEVGIYGATVQLIEQVGDGIVRDTKQTDKDGKFEFTNFLPGNYIIRYYYGDSNDTALLNTSGQQGVNGKSYNGEDFQATNNAYNIANMDTNILNKEPNYWYVYNESEGISTAWDNVQRRVEVSDNVVGFIEEQMTVLNNMRLGKTVEDSKVTYTATKEDGTTQELTITVNDIIEKTKMFADTAPMEFTVEKTELVNNKLVQKTNFDKYEITNMNFGIAEVPVTTVGLEKHVSGFNITDASGKNTIASMTKENDNWKLYGDVIKLDNRIDVSIEDEKLQGARLEITYEITTNMDTQVNYDGSENIVPTITGLVDFVNNNLSYDSSLGENSRYWEVTTHNEIKETLENQKLPSTVTIPKGTIDPQGTKYTTIVKATANNPLLLTDVGIGTATITLEKVLSSTDATIEQIITSTVDVSEYYNIVEIIGFDYNNTNIGSDPDPDPDNKPENPMRDRIRKKVINDDGEEIEVTIIPGVQYDYTISDTLIHHTPTGFKGIDTIYYIMIVIALAVLAAGVYGVKKFVVKK